ncbi:MAG: type 4a pilus biogenesis protein PilO [Desulfobacterales bacterium]|nr:type 4a pilus biogenesis protein PilO [Desulfobacterales bacterium]
MKKKKLQISADKLEPFFDKLSKLSMLYRFLICIVTYALLVAPFVWFSYLPKYEQIGKLEKEFEDLDNKLRIARTKALQLARMEALLEEAKDKFDLAKKKLPQAREIPDLLANITASGQESGLQFYLFEPRAESRKDFYAEIPVSIRVEGSYKDTAMFFYRVAGLSRIVNLKNISMEPKGPDKNISTSCNAVTYMFVEGK